MRHLIREWGVWLLILVATGACGDEPTGPAPGTYDVLIRGNTAKVGAVLFMVQGGPVDSIEPMGHYTVSAPFSGVATQVLVAGAPISGVVVRLHVPDRRRNYEAVLQQVAEAGTHRLLPTDDYSTSVTWVIP